MFRPQLIPTLFFIPCFIITIILGTWQIQRLNWKKKLISEIEQSMSQSQINLNKISDVSKDLLYRKVIARGEFLNDKEIHVYAGKLYQEKQDGYFILTPLKLTNGNYILVNRGFVEKSKKEQKTREDTIINRQVSVSGILMPNEKKTWVIPENDKKDNIWFTINIPEIKDYLSINLPQYYLMQDNVSAKNELLSGQKIDIKIRNDHLQYAITWYGLSLISAVIYYLYHKKK
ncbi:MAG: SURF1 family protein [Methanobacterium sp.]